ncbi:MAG: DUF1289 domain-containing protein [Gammaproteobacteria bacterium]
MTAVIPDAPASPCIRHCVLDGTGVCEGCGRTLDEISNWLDASAPQRQQICQRAQARREARALRPPIPPHSKQNS